MTPGGAVERLVLANSLGLVLADYLEWVLPLLARRRYPGKLALYLSSIPTNLRQFATGRIDNRALQHARVYCRNLRNLETAATDGKVPPHARSIATALRLTEAIATLEDRPNTTFFMVSSRLLTETVYFASFPAEAPFEEEIRMPEYTSAAHLVYLWVSRRDRLYVHPTESLGDAQLTASARGLFPLEGDPDHVRVATFYREEALRDLEVAEEHVGFRRFLFGTEDVERIYLERGLCLSRTQAAEWTELCFDPNDETWSIPLRYQPGNRSNGGAK